ncbi:MAG: ribbon-helix-helix protein, CopG family [Anaerolineales bacterium]|jgi:Arc/MetJ-type ribon-helix-helix transcriptional regulator
MGTKYRAQILLEPEQHEALSEIAKQEQRSISDLVREIIADWLAAEDQEDQRQRQLQALEQLTELRHQIQERHGVYTGDLIEEGRAERDEDLGRVWRGEA